MRRAELIMAVVMAVFSVYLMFKSAELPIGWVPRRGPGAGAFPFWLSAGLLLCCIWIIVRWVRRTSPLSVSDESYMDSRALVLFFQGAGSLAVMIALIHWIGVYGAIPLFLIFYVRVLGGHSWLKTLTIALTTPVLTFLFFEVALKITLPKGYTEPLFYPIFDLLY
jgi:hypothetical protein